MQHLRSVVVEQGWCLQVAAEFKSRRSMPEVGKNAAPHSGKIAWVRGLRERLAGDNWF